MATLDLQVSQSSGDCARHKNGDYWSTTHSGPGVGYYDATYKGCGSAFRFQNVTIPPGSTITAAYLTLRALASLSQTTVNTKIRGQNSANPATFSTQADFDARTWLATTVSWNNIAAWTAGQDYNSPDISAIIQAIIGLSGWASGNALVLTWDDWDQQSTQSANTYRNATHYDGNATYAPKLHIEYTPPLTEKTSSDTGSGVDACVLLETPEAKSSSDIGSGVDSTPVPSASLAGSETGAGIEALAARLLASVDTGSSVEVAQLVGVLKELFATELGEGSDSLTAKIEMPTKGGGMKLWT